MIFIYPDSQKNEIDFTILAKEIIDSKNSNEFLVNFSETFEEEQDTFPSQETNTEIETRAIGKATIFNQTSIDRRLIATTRLLSPDNILYRIKNDAYVPSNGKIEVEIYADQPGKESEISQSEIHFIIPGLPKQIQDQIYAQSNKPIKKSIKKNKIVTKENIKNATDELKKRILQKIQKAIDEPFALENEKNHLIPCLFVSEIIETKKDVEIGEQKDEFNLGIKLKITAIIFDKEKLLAKAKTKLLEKIYTYQKLVNPLQNFTYSVEQYNSKTKEALIKVHLEGISTLNSESEILNKNKLIGLKKIEIEEYFSQFQGIKKTEIKFSPFWVKRIPKIKNHIEIIIQ